MAHETFDEITTSIAWLDDALSTTRPLHKTLDSLQDDLEHLRGAVLSGAADRDDLAAMLADGLDSIRRTMAQADRASHQRLREVALGLWKELRQLRQQAPAPATATERHAELTKSVSSFLSPQATQREALAITKAVVRHFGPRGGQHIPYSRELAARLTLCKAISPEEHQRWKTTGRLPDSVNVRQPTERPGWNAPAQLMAQHLLASSGMSPLALQYWLQRSGR